MSSTHQYNLPILFTNCFKRRSRALRSLYHGGHTLRLSTDVVTTQKLVEEVRLPELYLAQLQILHKRYNYNSSVKMQNVWEFGK